eukprot:5028127-Pyramimonas_sp.AAC.1
MKAPIMISSKCAITAVPNCSWPKLGKNQSSTVPSESGRDHAGGDCGFRPTWIIVVCRPRSVPERHSSEWLYPARASPAPRAKPS